MRRALLMIATLAWAPLSAGDEQTVFAQVIDEDTQRIPSHTVAPEYPRKARRDRVEGEVQVCFDIDRNGRTRRIAVRRSTHRTFERPSIKAVRASLFKPLRDDQILQTPKTCRTFIFALEPLTE